MNGKYLSVARETAIVSVTLRASLIGPCVRFPFPSYRNLDEVRWRMIYRAIYFYRPQVPPGRNDRELRRRVTRARGFVILILMRPILSGRNNFAFLVRLLLLSARYNNALVFLPHAASPGIGHASISANFPSFPSGTLRPVVCLPPLLQVFPAHSSVRAFPLLCFIVFES